ncbi:MAG: alpha-L-arabinofuranosidase C-terminal domain-containing protein, partial [Planctomycetota bacterium]
FHRYGPWAMNTVGLDGETLPPGEIGLDALWAGWVSMPGRLDERGRVVVAEPGVLEEMRALGYRGASTEWNWNGWGGGVDDLFPREAALAQALGAAGYLNALIRQSDLFAIANQSMLLGHRWGISGIMTSLDGEHPPFIQPTAWATVLYARHHGSQRVTTAEVEPPRATPIRVQLGRHKMFPEIAWQDVVATRDADTLYVHAINRHRTRSAELELDVAAFAPYFSAARVHRLEAKPADRGVTPSDTAHLVTLPLDVAAGPELTLDLPPATVSVFEFDLIAAGENIARSH